MDQAGDARGRAAGGRRRAEDRASLSVPGLRDLFLLDPDVVFLNHGSFGACPRPVFDEYQRLQLELERRPIEFLGRRYPALYDEAKARLAAYLRAGPDDLCFVPNATAGMNVVARSLPLGEGDEVVVTDHEYGAVENLWRFVCAETGAGFVQAAVDVGPDLVDRLWQSVTPRTRVISVSHVTSKTALRLPVEEICRRARADGILSAVDGAHAPGQLELDLGALGADFYAGNCHKWLCAPKGAGFLWVRPEHQPTIAPLVVGWGESDADGSFSVRHRWQGTRDPAAYLAVPAAIDFLSEHGWDGERERCRCLASAARARLSDLGLEPLAPDDSWLLQMTAVALPDWDGDALQNRLYDVHRIEVPIGPWRDRTVLRASFQAYNDEADLDALIEALRRELPLGSAA